MRDRLKDSVFLDSLTTGGGNAFHNLLTKKANDLCKYSRLNGGKFQPGAEPT